jgi:hypothetical protein
MASRYDGKFVEDSSEDVTPSPHHEVRDGDAGVIDPESGVKRGLKNRHLSRYVCMLVVAAT